MAKAASDSFKDKNTFQITYNMVVNYEIMK